MSPEPPEDLGFRSLAAPWLDEDDLYAAMAPVAEPLWGVGRPSAYSADGVVAEPTAADRRRARHRELLEKWDVMGPPVEWTATRRPPPGRARTPRS